MVVCVSAGYRHSAAVSEDGELYTWGEGDFGRLGMQLSIYTSCLLKIQLCHHRNKIQIVKIYIKNKIYFK